MAKNEQPPMGSGIIHATPQLTSKGLTEEHGELIEAVERAWWTIDTKSEAGRKLMPAPQTA